MRLSRRDLRKIQYDFNSISNRLLQADYQDYLDVLGKFLGFIKNTPIIFEYISGCGCCEWDLEDEVKQVQSSYGHLIFSTGATEEEEVRNVYAVLQYIVERCIEVHRGLILAVRPQHGNIVISNASIPDRIGSSGSCFGRFPALNLMILFRLLWRSKSLNAL